MFSKKTVLVIGAGASKEVNLPIGTELSERIAQLLTFNFQFGSLKSGEYQFLDAMKRYFRHQPEISAHLKAAAQIADSVRTVNSIDNYIDIHRHDPRIAACGKAAIVYAILQAEKSSQLYTNTHTNSKFNLADIENTWLVEFGRILVSEMPLSEIANIFSNVTIICFNYDRVIEEFLTQWISQVYRIDRTESSVISKTLSILRPYGSVGDLFSEVPFGIDPQEVDFWNLSSRIKTFTEQIEDEELLHKMRSAIADAKVLVFLGFGFHRQNLKLISPEIRKIRKHIFSSAYGFSPADTNALIQEINSLFQRNDPSVFIDLDRPIYIDSLLTCYKVFTTYRRSLNPK